MQVIMVSHLKKSPTWSSSKAHLGCLVGTLLQLAVVRSLLNQVQNLLDHAHAHTHRDK